jgi:hypothetical protein
MPNPRLNNPYSQQPRHVPGTLPGMCACCGLPFKAKPRDQNAGRSYCDDCREHYKLTGESTDRRESRLVNDFVRVRDYYLKMRELLNRNELQLKDAKERVRSALRSRDHWQAKVEFIAGSHHPRPQGGCVCGATECRVLYAIEHVTAPERF